MKESYDTNNNRTILKYSPYNYKYSPYKLTIKTMHIPRDDMQCKMANLQ